MRLLKYMTTVLVAVTAAVAVPAAAHAAPSWNSGTVAPGGTQHWTWNNVPAGIAYEVGLTPMYATPSATCSFEIMRTFYVQQPGGEREFHFLIKNIGTISCATQIMLRELVSVAGLWQLPTLSPGASTTQTWNNASLSSAYAPGLVPAGATGSSACQLEVTRRWDLLHANNDLTIEREFKFVVKNVGSIACSGFVLLGAASDNSPINGSIMAVGEAHLFAWSNATPVDKSFIAGVKPSHTSLYGICTFEINRRWYLQRVVNGNTLVREVWGQVANIGNMTCAPHILLA